MMDNSKSDSLDGDHKIKFLDWGFKVDRLFEVAYRFYKRNENKAFHLGFDERNRMTALLMQAKFGNFDNGKAPDIGVLDLVGKRRQHEWSLLKGMSKTEAMTKFICELDDICPIFKAHAEAVRISSGLEGQINHNDKLGNGVPSKLMSQNGNLGSLESSAQLPGIYNSLCKQTHHQFKSYAEKQHPGDTAKQKYLIASLQEQYYQQYISQMNPKPKEDTHKNNQLSSQEENITSPLISAEASTLPRDDGTNSNVIKSVSNSCSDNGHLVKVNDQINQTTTESSEIILPKLVLDATDTSKCNDQFMREIEDVRPANISDINCEGDNVQADISCEELNSDLSSNMSETPGADNQPGKYIPTTILTNHSKLTPSLHNEQIESSQRNLIETVKLSQNFDTLPIGMFESFPQPKLLHNPHKKKAQIDSIDPNLPAKSVRNAQEEQIPENKIETDDRVEPSQNCLDHSERDSHQTSVIIPYEQDTLNNPTDHYNDEQDLEQNFAPIPNAYDEFNHNGSNLHECELTDPLGSLKLVAEAPSELPGPNDNHQPAPELWGRISSSDGCSPDDLQSTFNYEPLEPASIWTKRAVAEFKDSLGGDKQGGVYEIKEGALVIIQVPTYPDGKFIYWEFATENYDIGFGIDFVHEDNLVEPLALNIYQDNDDDDDLEDLVEVENWRGTTTNLMGDPEYCQSGVVSDRDRVVTEKRRRLANTVPILPTYRRDSHEEVFAGRHKYPGRGYYLLKFDNTYSVLRSKTLYFRICYFM